MRLLYLWAACLALLGCTTGQTETPQAATPLPGEADPRLAFVRLPPGFKIAYYAEGVDNARSLCWGAKGTLFVSTHHAGNVYALRDEDGDGKAEKRYTIATGLHKPNGIAFKDGSLYVAEVSTLWRYDNIEANLAQPPKPVSIYKNYPTDDHHGWKYIAFGPDGKLYIPVGAPCNICNHPEQPLYASITRMNPDGSGREVFASGVRNTVGFTWHPTTQELWFTDNGRDMLGDDTPPCELNHAPRAGMHFGYPFCHGGTVPDPEYGKLGPCANYTAPAQNLGPHVAPLGLKFYTGTQFPEEYRNHLLIAEHGSWNRSQKIGYRVMKVTLVGDKAIGYAPFAEGWLDRSGGSEVVRGRPVDVLLHPDGSVLVSDDHADCVYRIWYAG